MIIAPMQANLGLLLVVLAFAFFLFNAPVPRAKVFLGDTGALFLGFLIAGLSWSWLSTPNGKSLGPIIWIVVLLPIFADTIATLIRRAHEKKPLFKAHHDHHYPQFCADRSTSAPLLFLSLVLALVCVGLAVFATFIPTLPALLLMWVMTLVGGLIAVWMQFKAVGRPN